jgi:hypothetical protein
MADYGGRGFVMALPYIVGVVGAIGVCALFELKGGAAVFTMIFLTIVIAEIFKKLFDWK